jgi:DNA-binding CsgD family transcriptional regulator
MQRNSRNPQIQPLTDEERVNQSASISLTDRELQVLMWVAQGKTSWEIGQIIGCAACTVNFHCHNVMGKLDVCTRSHALFKALDLGLLRP